MARAGRVIGIINIFVIIATIVFLGSTYSCYWLNSSVTTTTGKVKSEITLRDYRFTIETMGVEIQKVVKLSEACREDSNVNANLYTTSTNATTTTTAATNESTYDKKLCKLYKGSLVVTILTAIGFVVSVINLILIISLLTCVNVHAQVFKFVTVFFSLGCFCLYLGSIVSYSLIASDINDVKHCIGWIIYIVGCVLAVISLNLSILTSNNKGYVTL